jgi:lysophospholipase L1-like esterase
MNTDSYAADSFSMKISLLSKTLPALYLLTMIGMAKAAEPVRIACVGDSITFGAGCKDPAKDSYPSVLQRCLGDGFKVGNFGVSGANLIKAGDQPYWKEQAFPAATSFAPNIVVIMLGTNDTKPQNLRYKAQFDDDLRALIDHFSALPTRPKIWVCLPAPVYQMMWGINQPGLDELLPVIKRVAAEKKARTIDVFRALSRKPQDFPDGVHPNEEGAAVMAKTVCQALEAAR